jgi:hypothetical protein
MSLLCPWDTPFYGAPEPPLVVEMGNEGSQVRLGDDRPEIVSRKSAGADVRGGCDLALPDFPRSIPASVDFL